MKQRTKKKPAKKLNRQPRCGRRRFALAAVLLVLALVGGLFGWMKRKQYHYVAEKYRVVMWDLVTRDYSRRLTAEDVVGNVRRYARSGSIITFHDSLKSIEKLRTALPAAIEWLRAEGYAFRTL